MSEWHTHSIFLEVKPRAELASLFVDCPPDDFENGSGDAEHDENNKENESLNLVRVSEHGVEIGVPHDIAQSLHMQQKSPRYRANISNLILYPQSLCATSWADNHRLFMCKLHVEADGLPLVPKTFHRLASDISDTRTLQEYCKDSAGASISLSCTQCGRPIVETRGVTLACMPSDDWLETSPSADYYCRDSCGAGCDPERHSKKRDGTESGQMHSDWFPTTKRYLVSHSYTAVNKESLSEPSICHDDRFLTCNGCHAELGTVVKNCNQIVFFHHAVCTLTVNSKPFLKARFPDTSVFFAHLVLSSCEAQSSLKLVVRSLDKTPHILIWLLDSYIVAATGELHVEQGEEEESGCCKI
ncbi:hypothetical protein OESDEN_09431 [Oesophagostomum dentatum]|uniref:E3 ubiquitin-protein ligase E3D n=1 Tax=Oesophagostomum dentatum TaxID=61180 RepID=A0A0B1T0H1_OESDE|nr:hypothetical protein OESDEN_09431 [Oesophagostomum dentatum]